MVAPIKKSIVPVTYKLDVDFKLMVHRTWLRHLNPLFSSKYMRNMMVFLQEIYKVRYASPEKKNIFKPFELTNFDNLKVVIIAGDPYHNSNATGLAFGNPDSSTNLEKEAITLRNCIERTCYQGMRIDHDYSLESWAKEGVLLLNSTLTYIDDSTIDTYSLWRNFIREIIKLTNDSHTGLCFLFLGNRARYFKKFVDVNTHYVFEHESPFDAIEANRVWNCPHFDNINEKIEAANGGEFCIEW
jgi:uracil-DNA glycosylase